MKKALFAVLAVALFGLAACGNKSSQPNCAQGSTDTSCVYKGN